MSCKYISFLILRKVDLGFYFFTIYITDIHLESMFFIQKAEFLLKNL